MNCVKRTWSFRLLFIRDNLPIRSLQTILSWICRSEHSIPRKTLGGKYPGDDIVQNLVFYTQKGTPTSRYAAEHALNRIVKLIDIVRAYKAKEAGEGYVQFIKLHPHALRHTFCSLLYYSKVDPKACQQLLGHANISTTLNIYTHLSGEAVSEELWKVEGLVESEKNV